MGAPRANWGLCPLRRGWDAGVDSPGTPGPPAAPTGGVLGLGNLGGHTHTHLAAPRGDPMVGFRLIYAPRGVVLVVLLAGGTWV